jgi:hypothetical protein
MRDDFIADSNGVGRVTRDVLDSHKAVFQEESLTKQGAKDKEAVLKAPTKHFFSLAGKGG